MAASILPLLGVPGMAWAAEGGTLRVHNGEEVETCGFAPVVSVAIGCTATLIHPRVILYAAHCGTDINKIGLGNGMGWSGGPAPDRYVDVKQCKTNPSWGNAEQQNLDYAYCELAQDVLDLPIIPAAYGCELEQLLKSGQTVTQCGFGGDSGSGSNVGGIGIKRWGKNTISSIDGSGRVNVGPSSDGVVGCPGDSGGPLLAQLEDGTWRTIGITSTYTGSCSDGNSNTYAPIEAAIKWVESETGIDVTPCFDGDGTWNPTEACGDFFAGGPEAAGTWDSWCAETARGGPSATCGDPFVPLDMDKPTVEVSEPGDGDTFTSEDGKVEVHIKAKLDDGAKGSGIAKATLRIDGKNVAGSELAAEPWEWEHELDDGKHTIEVLAVDKADNEATSAKITVTVESDEQTTESGDTTADDDDDDDADDDDDDDDDDADDDDDDMSTTDTSESDEGSDDDDDNDDDDDDEGTDDDDDDDDNEEDDSPSAAQKGCTSTDGNPQTMWWASAGLLWILGRARRRQAQP